MSVVEITVSAELDGERADKIIAISLEATRSAVKAIIESGGATVRDAPVKPSQKMRTGTVIHTTIPEPVAELSPESGVPFEIVHEDDSIAVVDKPPGVVIHPGSGQGGGTLVNGLMERYPEIVGVGQPGRWGIVHRLDKGTSGLLVVARTQPAYESLVEAMKAREVHRRYLCLVSATFTNTIGTIDAPIARDPQNPTRMHLAKLGRSARTHYRRIAQWQVRSATLLSVTLETGRTHQIRVHLRSIGHPVIGDHSYGKRGVVGDPGRPWLHARQLGFIHPSSGEQIMFLSRLPLDLSDSLVDLGEPDLGVIADTDGEPL